MRLIDADALPSGRVEWEDIVDAPTVDPVRHGEWIATEDPWFSACSVCGYLEWSGLWNNYCPECGSKMDGQETLSPFGKE